MAITLNDNIKINAGKPSESKYLSSTNVAYSSTTQVTTDIPIAERHVGLTVLVDTGTSNIEYWWREDVTDSDLVEKKSASEEIIDDYITGATNLGHFEGYTGIQLLTLSGSGFDTAAGIYSSQLNWYYGDSDGIIQIGSPTYNGIYRRAYVNDDKTYSWIYNVNVDGWSIATGDVTENVGDSIIDTSYGTPRYVEEEWSVFVTSGSTSITPTGSLTTGDTTTVGSPIYNDKSDQNLNLRTLKIDTPTILNLRYDDNYIYLSGDTENLSISASNGLTKVDGDINLGGVLTGITNITATGTTGVTSLNFIDNRTIPTGIMYGDDYSSGFTNNSLVSKLYVDSIVTTTSSLIKSICNPITDDYTAVSTDYYIGVSGGTIVKLSGAQTDGQVIIVADVYGNAAVGCEVQIVGSFIGGSAVSYIDTAYSSITYIYNGGKAKWGVVGFSPPIV